jgi:serine/threonine protein phosphatase PrpC/aminoglycoside phosphotransferase
MSTTHTLKVRVGQHSDKGRKTVNQDFYGATLPEEPLLSAKGVAVALADGISSSDVSQIASEFAVMGFLDDYYCTSQAWSVKRSAERVLAATNSWLHSRTQQSPYRENMDRGYVCTLSALVLKAHTAHVFHIGDARVYRLQSGAMEQLTTDHRVQVSERQSYLSRAVGFNARLDIDYHALPLEAGDVFVLATDGVHAHLDEATMAETVRRHRDDLELAARAIVQAAHEGGSPDNLTVQVVAVDELPRHGARELTQQLSLLPLPPVLEARAVVDGYRIVRELHASHRSHIYLAVDIETDATVVLKAPAVDLHAEPALLERFLLEEWIARRIQSPHVLKPRPPERERSCLYLVTEFIDGQTLAQWMIDHARPEVETVRGIVEQIARGLQAFHRLEMLHQDLRPENIMIDKTGTVKIIDFGSARVAGITEMSTPLERGDIVGTAQYTAPEYFLGDNGTPRSDQFSLGVIAYQMLSGRLPYGAEVAKARTPAAQRKLQYDSVLAEDREIPKWIDDVLKKAVHPDPNKRYEALSEFVHDLRHPTQAFLSRTRPPLVERHPVRFWKAVSFVLAVIVLVMLATRHHA